MSTLDELAARAQGGDRAAERELLERVRLQLLGVARRRVQPDDVEDVVQDTVAILYRKHSGRGTAEGTLAWSFSILRHVIGNYYGARGRKPGSSWEDRDPMRWYPSPVDPSPVDSSLDPLSRLEAEEARAQLVLGIQRLGESRCGLIFRRLVGAWAELGTGVGPEPVVDAIRGQFPGMTRNAFYVALHRCRQKLRTILGEIEEQVV